jgi:N-methylhydantoinase A/oxoprolinase/acetone carboxylase beta subunit
VACRITGPAIIEQMDTTTIVPPRAKLTQDRYGYLHIALETVANKRSAAWAAA